RDFTQREDEMLPLLFQDAGARTTEDGAVTVLQGRGVGGSTVHNTNLCKRAPDEVLASWAVGADGWRAQDLDPHYRVVERDLSVSKLEESDLNRNNALLKKGVEKLGWKGALLSHNRRGCTRSGFCELGCAFDAKENALKVLVPDAVAHGARVYADTRAERVLMAGGRAVGVEARALSADGRPGPRVTIKAAVCLSGSAVGSARLALESRLPDPNGAVGRGLRIHPGAAVAGIFDEVVEGWLGIPQSYECTEKLRFEEHQPDRTWIVPAFAHPIGIASALPGFGAAHMARMRLYPRIAIFVAMLHDQSAGSVAVEKQRLEVRYALDAGDQLALLRGMRACAELMLAAGARTVVVPFARPIALSDPSGLDAIVAHGYRPLDPLLTAVHPMGTLALGRVVDARGRWNGLANLWVADGSLFPSSIGGPPQLTIYAAAHKVAGHLTEELGRR
ncbi:MAG TPA: GMC family oxidoreductase N-terminal domain-containing protein, partial [Kofleriaceae bacterium]|nr:GMC family oxidoreductase N-terminal domain-containing protein [Kofleriaceae bacterium]